MIKLKLTRIMILAIFLLALVTLGVVSAADENMTELQTGEDIGSSVDVLTQEDSTYENQSIEYEFSNTICAGDENYYQKDGGDVGDEDSSAVEIYVENEKVVQGDDIRFTLTGASTGSYNVSALLNGTPVEIEHDWWVGHFKIFTGSWALGKYNLTIIYPGDGYLEPKTKEFTVEVLSFIVNIPENIRYNNYNRDAVYCLFTDDATGTLIISVDGKQIAKYNVAVDYDNMWSNDLRYFEEDITDLELPLGKHTVNVRYKGNKGSYKMEKVVNLGYSIQFEINDLYLDGFIYGNNNYVEIYLPYDAKGSFNITVNGKPFSKYNKMDYLIDVDISEFCGETVVGIEYSGDAKYNYPLKVNKTYTTKAACDAELDYVGYKDDDASISLSLPKDAKGNLVVEVNGTLYATDPFKDGKAEVILNALDLGSHSVKAYYDGDDYEVDVFKKTVYVGPKIKISSSKITYGQSMDIYINLPEGTNGSLYVNSKIFGIKNQEMVNGTAKVTLSNLPVSKSNVDVKFVYDDGSQNISESFEIYVYPNYTVSKDMVVFGKNTVSINTNEDFKGTFWVSDDSYREYKATVSNGKATITLPDLTAGEHTLSFWCYENREYRYMEEVDINVSKAANPKLVPTALSVYYTNYYIVKAIGVDGLPLKNAKIYFTIGDLTFKRTTDAKGQAILKMAYKPKTYTVVAQYSKKVKLTERVKVVGVVSFKAVTVKKSAKSLTLVASLKKGKKAIKNAKVYFTFNGKTYKAVTSKKGYAIVTIQKADLNRLKVGRTVAYQVAYGKNIVKYTAKVRR